MVLFRLAYALTLVLPVSSTSSAIITTNHPMQGCSIETLSLNVVNTKDKVFATSGSCCIVLNKAVETGFHCLYSLMESSSSPLEKSPLLMQLSNCFISAPSFTWCEALVPVVQQPPPSEFHMEKLLQPSVRNNILLPPPPPPPSQPEFQFPTSSDSDRTRSDCLISSGNMNQYLLLSTVFLAFILYFSMEI